MAIPATNGRETQNEHFKKKSFPMQGGICWFNFGGIKHKWYFHNIGDVDAEKDKNYTFNTLKWIINEINSKFGFRSGFKNKSYNAVDVKWLLKKHTCENAFYVGNFTNQ
jgi:hypothetical protein